MAATAASIAVLASGPAFCAATWSESSIVAAMAITNVFFMLTRISFLASNTTP